MGRSYVLAGEARGAKTSTVTEAKTTLQRVDSYFVTVYTTITTMNPGTANVTTKQVDQSMDNWGNLLYLAQFDYNGGRR